VDRKKDIIVSGGENIYPVEVENFFLAWDKIRDIAVIGYPDQRLGETVAAVIDIKPGVTLTEQDVTDYAQQLPRFQRPKQIFFGEVPRNPTGKIEKPRLRERYCRFD
jgi:acyl-CoA synthetase (AMP-forming)/AMP-acid ligase II